MIYTNEHSVSGIVKNLMYKIYGLMSVALVVTAVVAYYLSNQPLIMHKLLTNSWLIFGLFLVQILLVVILSAAILRLSFPVALTLLMVYSALMGITLSTIILIYTKQSIYTAFFVTSGMFGSMALYGYFTKTDLTSIGKYGLMALFGLIIGMIVNIFLKNGVMDYMLTLAGVAIFTLLTAYDVQKLKKIGSFLAGQGETINKIAVLGPLTLYLDFINLFLMILRLMGRRKE